MTKADAEVSKSNRGDIWTVEDARMPASQSRNAHGTCSLIGGLEDKYLQNDRDRAVHGPHLKLHTLPKYLSIYYLLRS